MTPEQIRTIAKQANGTPYVNRHYPGETAVAFGPHALIEFFKLVREQAFEEAAQACEFLQGCCPSIDHMECAEAIRKLK